MSKQIKALRSDDPNAWPATLAGLRDDVARQLKERGDNDVTVDLHLVLDLQIGAAADVLNAFAKGEPLPGAPVTTPNTESAHA